MIAMAQVKAHLGVLIEESAGEPVVITKQGKPVAVLYGVTDPDEVERLRMACSPKLQEILEKARQEVREGKTMPADEFWALLEKEDREKEAAAKARRAAKKKVS
jgi:prevent-host-death family protein